MRVGVFLACESVGCAVCVAAATRRSVQLVRGLLEFGSSRGWQGRCRPGLDAGCTQVRCVLAACVGRVLVWIESRAVGCSGVRGCRFVRRSRDAQKEQEAFGCCEQVVRIMARKGRTWRLVPSSPWPICSPYASLPFY